MKVGVPKEIKNNENRVAITPAGVHSLVLAGHEVLIESGAGVGSGFTDDAYVQAGATMVPNVADVWQTSEMIVKVKEPLEEEYQYFRKGLILFTYFHLAPLPGLTKALQDTGVTAVAYETVQLPDGSLPLLTPMSEVAGRMSIQIGAHFLEEPHGGRGVLLGGVPAVPPSRVVVVGAGTVGVNAARVALGMGAQVTMLDVNIARLTYIDELYRGQIRTVASNPYNLLEELTGADLLVGAVLIPGAKTPRIVTAEMVKRMNPGSVVVDVAIDQGGSIETIDRITTHDNPTYVKYGVIHYAVANMPGAVPRTSTFALTNATMPYAVQLANKGVKQAALDDSALAKGINVIDGQVTYKAVAEALSLPYVNIYDLLK